MERYTAQGEAAIARRGEAEHEDRYGYFKRNTSPTAFWLKKICGLFKATRGKTIYKNNVSVEGRYFCDASYAI